MKTSKSFTAERVMQLILYAMLALIILAVIWLIAIGTLPLIIGFILIAALGSIAYMESKTTYNSL